MTELLLGGEVSIRLRVQSVCWRLRANRPDPLLTTRTMKRTTTTSIRRMLSMQKSPLLRVLRARNAAVTRTTRMPGRARSQATTASSKRPRRPSRKGQGLPQTRSSLEKRTKRRFERKPQNAEDCEFSYVYVLFIDRPIPAVAAVYYAY